ncbi:hypothetical protein FOZ63_028661, partial [Perkinsus olseni]
TMERKASYIRLQAEETQPCGMKADNMRGEIQDHGRANVMGAVNMQGNRFATTQDIRSLQQRASRYAREAGGVPPLPRGLVNSDQFREETHRNIESLGQKTLNGSDFLAFNSAAEGMALFISSECRAAFGHCSKYFVDATFRVCPHPFRQLLTCSGQYGQQSVPLFWCLMSSKSAAAYRLAFREVNRVVTAQTGDCRLGGSVMTDFEEGLRGALRAEFAADLAVDSLRGCVFHLHKSWYSHLRSLGLEACYREEQTAAAGYSDENRWLHSCFGLCCLNPDEVRNAWVVLRAVAPRNNDAIQSFIEYLEANYVLEGSTMKFE